MEIGLDYNNSDISRVWYRSYYRNDPKFSNR